MIPLIFVDAIIYSSLLTLLSLGLTLTYLTTKVPNFAHGTFAAAGAYVTLTVSQVWNANIYHHLYLAFIIGGIIALAQYLIVLRPLMRRETSIVGLMITTLAIDIILYAVLNIYADYLATGLKVSSRKFYLRAYDIQIAGQEGLLIVAPTLAAVTATLLYLALTRTKFGVAMRAAIEDPSLASVVGINVNLVYAVSWFLAGGLAGLSGGLLPLRLLSSPDIGWLLIVSIFAASIVGGLLSIYGAVLGGYLVGLAEILGTTYLVPEIGEWVLPYRPLIPLIAMAVTLLLAPQGLLGVNWRDMAMMVWDKVVGFIRSPTETFNGLKGEDWGSSVKHYSKLLVVFAILQTVVFMAIYPIIMSFITTFAPVDLPVYWPPLFGFVGIFFGGLGGILVVSLSTHVWVYIFGGRKGVGQTIKSMAYGSTLFLLLGWIPFLGIAFGIWAMVLSGIGIRELHEISTGRTVAAFILGVIVTSILISLIFNKIFVLLFA